MKKLCYLLIFAVLFFLFTPLNPAFSGDEKTVDSQGTNEKKAVSELSDITGQEYFYEDMGEIEEEQDISDPFEPVNRVFFQFNDRLYFWGVKPLCKAYNKVMPERARRGIKSFFSYVNTPVRAANCILQGKFKGFVREVARFIINTTAGCLGFRDAAFEDYHIEKNQEDFGQTLGFYGIGFGPYLVIPLIGPSSIRDGVGRFADAFAYVPNYYMDFWASSGRSAFEVVNEVSLELGEYESFKETAIDPYVSIRQAYYQYRKKQVEK